MTSYTRSIETLPWEIQNYIFQFLPLDSSLILSSCSKTLRRVFLEISNIHIQDEKVFKNRYEILKKVVEKPLRSLFLYECQKITLLGILHLFSSSADSHIHKMLIKSIQCHDEPLVKLLLNKKSLNTFSSLDLGILAAKACEVNNLFF